jgi:hypothetical protein
LVCDDDDDDDDDVNLLDGSISTIKEKAKILLEVSSRVMV